MRNEIENNIDKICNLDIDILAEFYDFCDFPKRKSSKSSKAAYVKALINNTCDHVLLYNEAVRRLLPETNLMHKFGRSVSQCPTVEYCKGWNDAVRTIQGI